MKRAQLKTKSFDEGKYRHVRERESEASVRESEKSKLLGEESDEMDLSSNEHDTASDSSAYGETEIDSDGIVGFDIEMHVEGEGDKVYRMDVDQ